jgi:putative phage-type endonuclease
VTAATIVRKEPVQVLGPDMTEQEWLAARRQGVGASEVAAVIGVSPYQGPLHVWLDKLGVLGDVDNDAMEWGRRLEGPVVRKFADEHPELNVTPAPGFFAAADDPWRRATPDGIAEGEHGPELVEAKTGMTYGDAEQWGEPGTDEVPLSYLCQVTWACDVMGLDRWHLPVLLLDRRDYREYRGEFDPEFAVILRTRVGAFWRDNVLGGVEPAADGLPDTTEVLNRRYQAADRDVSVDLPREALTWAEVYRINHEAIAERKRVKDEAGNLLRQKLADGEAAVGMVDGEEVVTWRRPKPTTVDRFNEKRFAAEHPDLYAQYVTTETEQKSPTLRVKGVSW